MVTRTNTRLANHIAKSFWTERFREELYVTTVTNTSDQVITSSPSYAVENCMISSIDSAKIINACNRGSAAVYTYILTSIAFLMHKYNGCPDVSRILFGMPVFKTGTESNEAEILPVIISLDDERSFKELLFDVKEVLAEAIKYQDVSFLSMKEIVKESWDAYPYVHTLVVMDAIQEICSKGSVEGDVIFSIQIIEESIKVEVKYNELKYSQAFISRFLLHLSTFLSIVSMTPNTKLRTIDILTDSEKKLLLYDFNNTDFVYPRNVTLHSLFEDKVREHQDGIAVCFEGNHITYRDLNKRANDLAWKLHHKGIGPGNIVALLADVSIEMIVGILGVLKTGAAYLPIDPAFPQARINYLLVDSNTSLMLTNQLLDVNAYRDVSVDIMDIPCTGTEEEEIPNLSQSVSSKELAYIIYTSGTTGNPKGVMIEHTSVVNQIIGLQTMFEVNPADRHALIAPYTFDASVKHIFLSLTSGGQLHLIPEALKTDSEKLIEYLIYQRVSILNVVPSMMSYLLNTEKGKLSLRVLMLAGEVFPVSLYKRIKDKFMIQEIYNIYGPTECTINGTYFDCKLLQEEDLSIPIGKPLMNYRVYILDEHQQLVPYGVQGELYISGAGLARGYINNSSLTNERFINHPFIPEEKIYKTGDLVRWNENGYLEYIGRKDQQVKIAGRRIELGEIESVLRQNSVITETVVLQRTDHKGELIICAYYVANNVIKHNELREYAASRLPRYMVPNVFIEIDQVPLKSNGKINDQLLPAPFQTNDVERSISDIDSSKPRNETEELLIGIWHDVFGDESINIYSNYYDLGGDSIKAIQISAGLLKHKRKIKVRDIFEHQTIAALSQYIETSHDVKEVALVLGEIPLTPSQMYFFDEVKSERHHWNQSVLLFRKDGFNSTIVKNVFKRMIEHHDILRAVFSTGSEGEIVQTVQSMDSCNYGLHEFYLENMENKSLKVQEILKDLQASLNLSEGPLINIGIIRTMEGDYLAVIMHHLLTDGISWRILLEDFSIGYSHLMDGQPFEIQGKTTSYRDWANKLREFATSDIIIRDRDYWECTSFPTINPLPKWNEISQNLVIDIRTITEKLNTDETALLLKQACKYFDADIDDILIAALSMTISDWARTDRVAIVVESHGREEIFEDIDISRTVGWFTSSYPLILDMSERSNNLSDRILAVKSQRQRIPNKGITFNILKYISSPRLDKKQLSKIKPEICFNYLGQISTKALGDFCEVVFMPDMNSVSKHSTRLFSLEVEVAIINGSLMFSIHYNKHEYEETTIAGLVAAMLEHLQSMIQDMEHNVVDEELADILNVMNEIDDE
ncbi:non-ribosomal peptide synthetase [Paenibacillus tengchongensis]|uniref:non-ribosomal peptide synthetase n=1 Tax=Paenibacillus tengchongensis TaxID=2608684 RepID=UPI00124C8296|nr:non-ribosomal peptide synthetase [Paenibacillus tengchongensis]